jgi:hypothetical protein
MFDRLVEQFCEFDDFCQSIGRKCCNFENGDGGGRERNWSARSQAARSNSLSMN